MAKTKFKIIPPLDREDPSEVLRFKCGDCGEAVPSLQLTHHAVYKHKAGSILVDSTLNWSEIDRKRKENK